MSLSSTFTRRMQNVVSPSKLSCIRNVHGTCPKSVEQLVHGSLALKDDLRKLFRNIAQPVVVITSFMPHSSSPGTSRDDTRNISLQTKFHGATLSSFTSIAMDPHPLVAFALRLPSRMAGALSSLPATAPAHMVVNLLSADQASTAIAFSRPDLYPSPFTDSRYTLSEDGLPVLKGVVGAVSCKLVRKGIPLYDLDHLGAGHGQDSVEEVALKSQDVTSELFIARVVRVESLNDGVPPLVYHHRTYTTCPDPTKH